MNALKWKTAIIYLALITLVSVASPADLPGSGGDSGKTVVYRDTWGVPHIYAPTVEAGMYAIGWTQAEDRPEELLKNFMRAMGESASFDGPGEIQSDMVSRLWDHYGTSKKYFDRNRPEIRDQIKAYVKGAGERKITIWSSHHGPIVAMREGKAYAAKISYADEVQISEAWHEFNMALDYRGAIKGMDTQQLFPQNVMVADTSGNIYYQRTGRVPRRPSGYDWSKPVDGSTSATEWQGLHPASDHVQVLNPPQGYMQNCNIPPDVMMVDSPLTPDKTLSYLYGSSGGYTNQRGARAVELLHADSSVTIEDAQDYAVDVHPYGVERWLEVLKQADDMFGELHKSNPDYAAGIEELRSWDGQLRRDSTAALKYYYWRKQIIEDHGAEAVSDAASRIDYYLAALGKPAPEINLSEDELVAAADSLASAMAKLKEDHGLLNATYGDTFRVGRDDTSWPLGGGGGNGLTTLRNISYGQERNDHTRWGTGGQTSTQVIVLSKPIRSWTYVPIGQSDRPDSTHYHDQAEKLFSIRKLKPTWWLAEDLAKHIESSTVLTKAP